MFGVGAAKQPSARRRHGEVWFGAGKAPIRMGQALPRSAGAWKGEAWPGHWDAK